MSQEYSASTFAAKLGISVKTLNRYESLGYFPKPKKQKNGYRYYTDEDVTMGQNYVLENKSKKRVKKQLSLTNLFSFGRKQ